MVNWDRCLTSPFLWDAFVETLNDIGRGYLETFLREYRNLETHMTLEHQLSSKSYVNFQLIQNGQNKQASKDIIIII